MIWEEFEKECTDFLTEKFGSYATFEHLGESDSTVPDIKVITTNSKKEFYIEAKHSPAQCGQFVLIPDFNRRVFTYSKLNISPLNQYAQFIINHMNGQFDLYSNAGTSGENIQIRNGENIFASWIIDYYRKKGVRFFISNNNIIIPIENFHNYFNVSAKYRIKRSGSSEVGKADIEIVKEYLLRYYNIIDLKIENKKLFIKSNLPLHNKKFVLNGKEYMISHRNEWFEIRKLSNTFNANVIFSITIKNGVNGISAEEFIQFLLAF